MLSFCLIHVMIYIISFISYFYLNKIHIKPFSQVICCNKSLTNKDVVYEPENISVPFEDISSAIEQVVEDFTHPPNQIAGLVPCMATPVKSMVGLLEGK